MIIVSQDREDIINFDNVKMITTKGGKIGIDINLDGGDFEEIGEYETEERAKEVLREIMRVYQGSKIAECATSNTQVKIAEDFEKRGHRLFLYEMPEK